MKYRILTIKRLKSKCPTCDDPTCKGKFGSPKGELSPVFSKITVNYFKEQIEKKWKVDFNEYFKIVDAAEEYNDK